MAEPTAERIMATAREHFLRYGFERASTDAIARDARASKQTIYDLYPTKVDLFAAIMRDAARDAIESSAIVPADGRPLRPALCDYVSTFFGDFLTSENRGLQRSIFTVARLFPDLAAELHRYRLTGAQPLTGYLTAQMEAGAIAPGDAYALSRRLGSAAVDGSYYLMGFAAPDLAEQRALSERVIALLLHGYPSAQQHANDLPPLPNEAETEAPKSGSGLRLTPERVAALLDAAGAEFVEQGFKRASIDTIVAATTVSSATIYRHFGDKRGLFRRTMQHLCEATWDENSAGPPKATRLDQSLYELARWTLERHLTPASLALQRLLVCEAEQFPDVARAAYRRMADRPLRELRSRLAQGGAQAPDPVSARAFFTLATHGIRFLLEPEPLGSDARDRLSRESVALFLEGCSATS